MLSCTSCPTDSEIIKLLKSNCRAGTAALYDRYARALLLSIYRMVPDRQAAEKALTNTFVDACRTSAGDLPEPGMLLSWMMSIAREQAAIAQQETQSNSYLAALLQLKA